MARHSIYSVGVTVLGFFFSSAQSLAGAYGPCNLSDFISPTYPLIRPEAPHIEEHGREDNWRFVQTTPNQVKHRVLLIPGLFSSHHVFRNLLSDRKMANYGVQLIAASPPGYYGQPVKEGFDFSIPSYAALTETVASRGDISAIAGLSFGAHIALETAARGNYKGKILLINPSMTYDEIHDTKATAWVMRQKLLSKALWTLAQPILARHVKRSPLEHHRALMASFVDDTKTDLLAKLGAVKNPLWYVSGGLDSVKVPQSVRDLIQERENLHLVEIPEAGHLIPYEQPDLLNAAILKALGIDIPHHLTPKQP